MRFFIVLSTLLASASLIRGDTTCDEKCNTIIDKGCAKGDVRCICNPDFNIQISLWKCLYDSCPLNTATLDISLYNQACNQAAEDVAIASKTLTSEAAIPTGTLAKAFTVPSCATSCVSKNTIPRCKNGEPACVCDAAQRSDEDISKMNKCIVDSCNTQDAAVALTTYSVDCGTTTKDFPADQLPFPFNGFALAKLKGAAMTNDISIFAVVAASVLGVVFV